MANTKPLVETIIPNRFYEVTYLVASDLTSSELATIHDEVNTLIGRHSGTIKNTDDWGKRDLAYPIKDAGKTYREGTYTHLLIEMPANKTQKLARELELKRGLLRNLIVQVDAPQEDKKATK